MGNGRVCCICFSNTLKLVCNIAKIIIGVCCICFSNTLKPSIAIFKAEIVWVVFVLAILSNIIRQD